MSLFCKVRKPLRLPSPLPPPQKQQQQQSLVSICVFLIDWYILWILLAICSNTCPGGLTSDVTTTCGRKCYTVPLGAFGTPTGSVGSTSNCYMNSTYCPGGSYVVVRNTYSSVNFDCDGSYGCNANGGCCVGIGSSPNFGIYCISCHY